MRALCRGPQKTGHVHRVGELSVALDLFSPSWKGRERHSVRTDLADETETRVDVGSLGMRLAFYAYWALIRMPSGLIRRHWLAAVVRRATAEHLRGSAITEHRKYEHR